MVIQGSFEGTIKAQCVEIEQVRMYAPRPRHGSACMQLGSRFGLMRENIEVISCQGTRRPAHGYILLVNNGGVFLEGAALRSSRNGLTRFSGE